MHGPADTGHMHTTIFIFGESIYWQQQLHYLNIKNSVSRNATIKNLDKPVHTSVI